MFIQIQHFSKQQTTILKGMGILLIVLHNFYHNLTPIMGENEFSFSEDIFWGYCRVLQTSPEQVLRVLFSYFGHYGVQVFIFFSSYGLTRKYHQEPINMGPFLIGRIKKFYLSFLLCIALYMILGLVKFYFMPDEKIFYWHSLLWKVLLISNFIPGQALMPVGPWWFIVFIFQVYVLFPWLLKYYLKWGAKFLVGVSLMAILLQLQFNTSLITQHLNINYTVFGHLPMLCLGMFFAKQAHIDSKVLSVVISLSFCVLLLANVESEAWLFSNVALVMIVLAISPMIFKVLSSWPLIESCLLFYGKLSFHLFLVNGFLRSPFHTVAERYHVWWLDNLAALACLLFATFCAVAFLRLDEKLRLIICKGA